MEGLAPAAISPGRYAVPAAFVVGAGKGDGRPMCVKAALDTGAAEERAMRFYNQDVQFMMRFGSFAVTGPLGHAEPERGQKIRFKV